MVGEKTEARAVFPLAPAVRLTAETGQEILWVYRFGKNLKLVSLNPGAVQKISRGSLSGKEQDLAVRQHGPDGDGGINAVHVGHDDVGNEHVGTDGAGCFYGLFTVVDSCGFKPALI